MTAVASASAPAAAAKKKRNVNTNPLILHFPLFTLSFHQPSMNLIDDLDLLIFRDVLRWVFLLPLQRRQQLYVIDFHVCWNYTKFPPSLLSYACCRPRTPLLLSYACCPLRLNPRSPSPNTTSNAADGSGVAPPPAAPPWTLASRRVRKGFRFRRGQTPSIYGSRYKSQSSAGENHQYFVDSFSRLQ